MKKQLAAVLSCCLVGAVALSVTACGMTVADGTFPYDAAVERGYDGNEGSWLASLDTPSSEARRAYEELVEYEGYTGSYETFLKEIWQGSADYSGAVNSSLASVVSIISNFGSGRQGIAAAGAGVIYSLDKEEGDAYIVTNLHVVYDADYPYASVPYVSSDITLYLYGSYRMEDYAIPATFVGGSMQHDIAVLAVEDSAVLKESSARAVTAADSDSVTVGEQVFAIGNPEGDGFSVTEGVVSVDAEYINITAADEKTPVSLLEIRTDAAVNHGNSGGGLFNAEGELVGIVNARSEEEGVEAFGYAIPSNLALRLAQNVIDNRTTGAKGALCARLGITVSTDGSYGVFDEMTQKYYIEEKVVVQGVSSGSAAARAGLDVNDTLVSVTLTPVNGEAQTVAITRRHKLTSLLFDVRRGDTLTVTVSRAGELLDLDVTFENDDFLLYGLSVPQTD